MLEKYEIDTDQGLELELKLKAALEITDVFGRRHEVNALIHNGAKVTSQLLEQALATYDFVVIKAVMGCAIENGFIPTTECINIMIAGRAEVTEKAVYHASMRGSAVDPSYSLYALQAETVKSLIEAGTPVTPEMLEKSITDEQEFGDHRIKVALENKELKPTSEILLDELKRLEEIKKNSRVLGQAFRTRTSFFSTLPEEALINIASLLGKDENVIQENKSDVEVAANSFAKPN